MRSLERNLVGAEGAKALASSLEVNAVLTELNLASNKLGGDETGYVKASEVEGVSKEVGAKVIYQGREMTVSKGVDSDGDMKMVDLSGVFALAEMIKSNTVLRDLK